MIVEIYANYGVLAHEKETVYTTAPHEHATLSEPILINLPDSVSPCENFLGETLVTLDGKIYLLSEVLSGRKGDVALKWFDGKTYRQIPVERKT